MKKVIIFGLGDIAQLAHYYLTHDSSYEISGFTVDKKYLKESKFQGLPVVEFETLEKRFSPNDYAVFIAVSYSGLNSLREKKYTEAKKKGFKFISYVSSRATVFDNVKLGENCMILENNVIQPFVEIGNNVTLWSGNHIGHHSVIDNHCFISSHVVVSGHVHIKASCFIGVNVSIRNGITIESGCMVGQGAILTKDTKANETYVIHGTKPFLRKKHLIQP